jgi:hypothetical protein
MVGPCIKLLQDGSNRCVVHDQPESRFKECGRLKPGGGECGEFRRRWLGRPSAQGDPDTKRALQRVLE